MPERRLYPKFIEPRHYARYDELVDAAALAASDPRFTGNQHLSRQQLEAGLPDDEVVMELDGDGPDAIAYPSARPWLTYYVRANGEYGVTEDGYRRLCQVGAFLAEQRRQGR